MHSNASTCIKNILYRRQSLESTITRCADARGTKRARKLDGYYDDNRVGRLARSISVRRLYFITIYVALKWQRVAEGRGGARFTLYENTPVENFLSYSHGE